MQKDFNLVCVVLFILAVLSPLLFSQHLTDILVNTEPDTNAFQATSSSLHVLSPEKCMVIWHDDRGIVDQAWAQLFDREGKKLDETFKVQGGTFVSPYNDQYTILSYFKYTSGFEYWYFQHFKDNLELSEPVQFQFYEDLHCDVSVNKNNIKLHRTHWGNIWIKNACGNLSLAMQNSHFDSSPPVFQNMNFIYTDTTEQRIDNITNHSIVNSPDSSGSWMIMSRLRYPDYTPQLLLVKIDQAGQNDFFTKEIVTDSLLGWYYVEPLLTEMDSDSTITLFYVKNDSLMQTQIDTCGNILNQISFYFEKPDSAESWTGLNTYFFSNEQSGTRYLLLGNSEWKKKIKINNLEIESISEHYINTSLLKNKKSNKQIYLNPDDELFISSIQNGKTTLFKLTNTNIELVQTLETPGSGVNQVLQNIIPINETEFAITYTESNQNKAAILNTNGEILEYDTWPENEGLLFDDGKILIHLHAANSNNSIMYMKTYDLQNDTLINEIPLLTRGRRYFYDKLDNDTFFIFHMHTDHLLFAKFTKSGELVDTTRVDNNVTNTTFFKFTKLESKYWLYTNYRYFLWDTDIMKITNYPALDEFIHLYPLNESLLFDELLTSNPDGYKEELAIIDTSGVIIKKFDTPFSINNIYSIIPLSKNIYMLIDQIMYWTHQYGYKFRIFNSNLDFLYTEPINLFPNATINVFDIPYQRIGNHIVFACTDIRDTETGQNVYASIFNINDLITGVENTPQTQQLPEQFSLSAPSPNPSRSGQSITFQLDMHRQSSMEFKLYNILGQRIKTYNRQFNAGQQSVNFQLPNLAAGVYFLKATDNQQAIIKKIAVIR